MNPEKPSHDEIEAKLTALLLGELPEDEARVLRYTISQDAELTKLHDRLKATIGLVRHVSAQPAEIAPLKLSEERRRQLFSHFKTPRPQEEVPLVKRMRIPTLIQVLAVVAMLAILAAMLLPALSAAKNKSQHFSQAAAAKQRELQAEIAAEDRLADEKKAEQPKAEPLAPVIVAAAPVLAPPPASLPPAPQKPAEIYLPPTGGEGQVTATVLSQNAATTAPTASSGQVFHGGALLGPIPTESPNTQPPAAAPASPAPSTQNGELALDDESAVRRSIREEAAAVPAERMQSNVSDNSDTFAANTPQAGFQMSLGATSGVVGNGQVSGTTFAQRLNNTITSPVAESGLAYDNSGNRSGGSGFGGGAGGGGAGGNFSGYYRMPEEQAKVPDNFQLKDLAMNNSAASFASPTGQFSGSTMAPAAENTFAPGTSAITVSSDGYLMAGTQRLGKVDYVTTKDGRKVPVVGDMPMVGRLFSNSTSGAAAASQTEANANGAEVQAVPSGAVVGVVNAYSGSGSLSSNDKSDQLAFQQHSVDTQERMPRVEKSWAGSPDFKSGLPSDAASVSPARIDPNTGLPMMPADRQMLQTNSIAVDSSFNTGLTRKDVAGLNYIFLGDGAHQKTGNLGSVAGDILTYNDQAKQIRELHSQVDKLHADLGILDDQPASVNPTPTLSRDELKKIHDDLVTGEQTYQQQAAQYQRLRSIEATNKGELSEVIPTMFPDSTLVTLNDELHAVQQEKEKLAVDYSANQPQVAKDQALIDALNRQIDDRVNGVMNELNGQLTAKKASLDVVSQQLVDAQQKDYANTVKNQPYYAEKIKLQQLEEIHQLLYEKLKAQSIDAAMPRTSEVQITKVAQPGKPGGLWDRLTGKVESTASVKMENEGTIIAGMSTPSAESFSYDPYFIQTEFEVIQSQLVLGKVVDKLNLQQKWAGGGEKLSRDEAVAMLKDRLTLGPVKGTRQIFITAESKDPNESANLANAVAQAYRDYRIESSQQQLNAGLVALNQAYADQQQKIDRLQGAVDQFQPQSQPTPATAADEDRPLRQPAPNAPIPQPEVQVSQNAFSTFAMNVSDVSFKLAKASLEKGVMPEAAGIRSEEFINAFDYRDPEATAGQPIAFNAERAQDPFEQSRDFLRFSIKTAAQGRQAGRPLNLVLLLDNSGSMERADRVAIIREALHVLASQLSAGDTVSVVTFARTATLWVDGIPGDQAGAALAKAGDLTPQGGTNLEEAMRLAYETARRHYLANGMNRVVLLTDGAANLGSVDARVLTQKVEDNRRQGIALDCFGIGWEDYNDDLLEQLTSHGDGRYAFLNTPEDAANGFASKLAGALQVAAEEVKVQVEFNPDRVIAYRQIGYATHQLTKEQFRDNTVAAGEIAAQEAGNALYTVDLKPDGSGPIATVRLRYRVPGTQDYRERSWNVDYTGHAPRLDKSGPAMRLCVTSAEFAEWLATSPYAQQVTLDQLLNDLRGVPEKYGADTRPKDLEWMIRQAQSASSHAPTPVGGGQY